MMAIPGYTDDEITTLATLRESIEWETVESVIQRQIKSLEGRLGDTTFDSLQQVADLQGERRGLKWFLGLVERAYRENTKE